MSTSHFPLYNIVENQLPVVEELIPLTNDIKDQLAQDIKGLNQETQERVYGIIKSYDINSSKPTTLLELPFSGKQLKSGVKFDIENFPIKLQYMLLTFITLHNNSEDS